MKTYSAKPSDVTRKWYVVDASEAPLGRIATQVAQLLTGKMKPMFTHHIDCGDYVVIVNAEKLISTGDKTNQKSYYHYSGFPGGLRDTKQKDMEPTQVIVRAVRGMIPANKLRAERMKRLKVYIGEEHEHEAQKPVKFAIKDVK
jgi:large subunit ribosomal protein L13